MELQLSDDQQAFVDTARRFLAAECSTAAVRATEAVPEGFDRGWWRRGAELGWTSLLVPESAGGGALSEHGLSDLALVAEEMGRCVAPGPLAPVNVVVDAVGRSGSPAQRAAVLPGLLDGSAVATWCGPSPIEASDRTDATTGVVLTGRCTPVEAAAAADHLLVTYRHRGSVGQALLAADAPGVTVTPLHSLDLVRRFAEVHFDGVEVPSGALLGGAACAERQLQVWTVLQCAETIGAIDRVLAMTIEYLGDRYSFGRPLASYQALKHRVADQKLWLEASHAITTGAVRAVAAQADNAAELASAAAAWVGPHATELVQDCIQLHGGIGVTWEHDLHLYLRRVTVNRATVGTPEFHAERIATNLLGAAS